MRHFCRWFLAAFAVFLSASVFAQSVPTPPAVAARAWLLLDVGSGQLLASERPDERIEPASLTKLMTAYLTFSALKQKSIAAGQQVPISPRAWKSQGSRMFIEPNMPVTVDQLIHGVIIQSGNDACVALAELIAGSEELFAQMMNREAQRLGLKNSHFMNATGLPDPQHYTTARDLSVLASAIIRDFPEYYPIYSQKEYTYNRITQANRNRLLYLDPTVDGMKTGHTDSAGYCLIATAKRGPRRLLSVVLGTASDALRAQESGKLLNFGFQFYDTVQLYRKDQAVSEFRVWKGSQNAVKAGFPYDFTLSLPHGMASRIKASLVSQQPLIAPIAQGARIGTLKLTLDDKPWADYPVQALEAVPVAGFFGRLWDTIRLWLQ
ncbi:MAG: D-alanyl-D-alanine carboxypeptidase [Rhodocyclaceae bacterium]|nr:D-alanyl-D-alanine carboxypeptidase [Rhodocyclaceae bacterium]